MMMFGAKERDRRARFTLVMDVDIVFAWNGWTGARDDGHLLEHTGVANNSSWSPSSTVLGGRATENWMKKGCLRY